MSTKTIRIENASLTAEQIARPLRVTHVVRGLYFGGVERLLLETCKAQPPWHTSILALDERGPLARDFEACGPTVHCLHRDGTGHLDLISALRKQFRQTKPDVVHVHTYVLHAIVALAAKLERVPRVVISIHEVQRWLGGTSILWDAACWASLPLIDRQIAVSEAVYSSLGKVGMPTRKATVVYNGIDSRTSPVPKVERSNGRADHIIAGTVIRLDAAKDYPTLLYAAWKVLGFIPRFEFWVVGDGSDRVKAERLAKELEITPYVRFLGYRRDVVKLLSQMDIFVFPATAREGLGVALLEAMRSGLPCVASDAAACPEIIQHGVNGLLYRCSDSNDLADKIRTLAGDSDLRERVAACALKTVQAKFDIQNTIAGWHSIYKAASPGIIHARN